MGPDFGRLRNGAMPYGSGELLTSELCLNMVTAGLRKSAELNVAAVICILDSGGHYLALHRMTSAMIAAVDFATSKALTSVRTKQATHNWNAWFREGGPTHGMIFPPGLVSIPGGFPLVKNGVLAGAVGVSGGEWEDLEIAAACIAAGQFWDGDIAPAVEKIRERFSRQKPAATA